MNALQLIVQELDEKYNLTVQKLTSGSIKDHAEYRFVCGSISSIISIKDFVVQLEKRIDEDE
tara:strand:- start:1175 stop:1360 length:186 start_codon:yes stop_codon:yes gene_type:complete